MTPSVEDRNGNIIGKIGDNDVLIDGGDRHPGNLLFLDLHRRAFMERTNRQRAEVLVEIVAAIHSNGGRFLKQYFLTTNWRELDRAGAIAATGRLFDELPRTIPRVTEVPPEQPSNPATVMETLPVDDDQESEVWSNNYSEPAELVANDEHEHEYKYEYEYDYRMDGPVVVVPEEDVLMVPNDDVLTRGCAE